MATRRKPNLNHIEPGLRGLAVPIGDVHVDPKNARRHPERNLEAIRASLREFGQQEPILALADGTVVAGNGRLVAAVNLGWTHVAVVRTTLEGARAAMFAITANRTAELAEWDDGILASSLEEIRIDESVDPLLFGFDEREIAALDPQPVEIVEDEVSEPPTEPVTKPGDMWLLGDHRVLCGDSTKGEDVARVMGGMKAQMVFTDPPYGVGYDGGTTVREKLAGDEGTHLYVPACKMAAVYSDEASPLYLWHAGVKGIAAAAAAAAAGYTIRCELVWNKNQAQFGALSAQYKQKHEPCYYCFKRGAPPRWYGPTNEVTVWDCNRASANEFHPTQKPVALAARAIGNSTAKSDFVLDLFLGGGTTLIAAEQLGRKCFGIEIEPRYVDVVCNRWAKLTGQVPVRESDGFQFPMPEA